MDLQHWIEQQSPRVEWLPTDLDSWMQATDPLSKQYVNSGSHTSCMEHISNIYLVIYGVYIHTYRMHDLASEDAAIDETIRVIERELQDEKLNLTQFLKVLRGSFKRYVDLRAGMSLSSVSNE